MTLTTGENKMFDLGNAKVPDAGIVWCTFTPNDNTDSVGRKKL